MKIRPVGAEVFHADGPVSMENDQTFIREAIPTVGKPNCHNYNNKIK
jgi:hypothetical protein